jgi:hypothetical protein
VTSRFTRGYMEQAFRRLAVRAEKLLSGAANAPYLQREDHKLLGQGRVHSGLGRVAGPQMSIRVKVEQEAAEA